MNKEIEQEKFRFLTTKEIKNEKLPKYKLGKEHIIRCLEDIIYHIDIGEISIYDIMALHYIASEISVKLT